MAEVITSRTRLKRGDIVRVFGNILGVVVRHEKFLNKPGFYAFNNAPGDKEFIKEYGVDWYKRSHITELADKKAEIITRDELAAMYKKNPTQELKVFLEITQSRKKSR